MAMTAPPVLGPWAQRGSVWEREAHPTCGTIATPRYDELLGAGWRVRAWHTTASYAYLDETARRHLGSARAWADAWLAEHGVILRD
jgi:hypothetical protein